MGALEFICDRRFHRSFVVPANPESNTSKPYHVSYSDFGDADSKAIVLFCGALFGQRLCYAPLDQLAKAHHVRIIHPDRPGVGGSEAVEPEKRVQTWLEMAPKLLAHLNISHVSIASHSGGDIYLMNFILAYPHLLNPNRPYVAFFAPWVHYSHSKMTHLQATELLPASWIGKFGSIGRFVNQNIIPVVGLSGAFVKGISAPLSHSDPTTAPVALTVSGAVDSGRPEDGPHDVFQDIALDDPKAVDDLREHITKFVFAENVDGVSADTQLLLKRSVPWSTPVVEWKDLDDAVQLLSKTIAEDDRLAGSNRVWSIDCFHGEHDQLVGDKGRDWFNAIWTPSQSYQYRPLVIEGTEHDFLMDPTFGASEQWLQRVSESWQTSQPDAAAP
ncbi:unnamed protein product [Alternaria alternata]|uniref:uncharacterized protein n=1 Tax=Alternaria postmessia TaxID=1187938 RepID=UPI0022248129|nr:uncharacterized protein J4E82_009180 [Alternaria postmessia]KAI5372124.1 hypothetical protein J4E82_009180 [Alternaria postmessia]